MLLKDALKRAACMGAALIALAAHATEPRPRAVQPEPVLCARTPESVTTLTLPAGKSRFMELAHPVTRLTVGNPDIIEARLTSPRGVYLSGMKMGSTNLILQSRERCEMLDVSVGLDPTGLQGALEVMLPDEKWLRVGAAADSLVLMGKVSSPAAADHAVSLATAFVRAAQSAGEGGRAPAANPNLAATRVVNMMTLAGPQQVMLEVKVAEVSKTLLDQLGVRTVMRRTPGFGSITLLSDFFTGTANGIVDLRRNGRDQFLIEAEKKDGLVRILAEPTVMALSGQEGSFLAGGKVLIPVAQSNTGSGGTTVTLEEKEFGVGLKFTPTVLADGRINLKVSPEVSELSREGVGIRAAGVVSAASVLPLITTRRASTTVQLYDGQSFAIGGLIKNSASANVKAFPGLGEIPVLGVLFRSTDFQSEKTELLFVVTPRLVKPLPQQVELPTDHIPEPDRNRLMQEGRMESQPPTRETTP